MRSELGVNQNMSILADLTVQREIRNRHEHWRYYIHRAMNAVRSVAMIAFGFWCYTYRSQLQSFLERALSP